MNKRGFFGKEKIGKKFFLDVFIKRKMSFLKFFLFCLRLYPCLGECKVEG